MNIVDPILLHARYDPGAVAICTPGTDPPLLTYGELEGWTNNISRLAVALDLARGHIVAVYVAERILHLAIVLALARMGIPTISPRSPVLPKAFDIAAVITDRMAQFENAKRVIVTDASWKRPHERPLADARFYQTGDDELCRISLTSGTTGEAKAVGFTHDILSRRVQRDQFARGSKFSACRRLYCDFGLEAGIGFWTVLSVLWRGGAVYLFGADSESMVQAFDLYKVEAMLTAPHGLSKYLQFYELPGAPECTFEFVVCLGAPLSRTLSSRAQANMSPNLFYAYGSTECGQTAGAPIDLIKQIPGAVGFVPPDMTVEIVNDADRALPFGSEGRVRIKSSQSVSEYLGDPTATADAFRSGWFYPGDLGTLTANRLLVISGRSSSVINLGGDKISPELIESVLVTFGKVQEAAVFDRVDQFGIAELCAAIVCSGHLNIAALQNICAQRLGSAYAPRHFIQVAALPKSDAGKLDRSRLTALALSASQN